MKRKWLAVITSVLLLCAMLPLGAVGVSAATSGTTGDCRWELVDGHLTIFGEGKMGTYIETNSAYSPYYTTPWGKNITSVTIEDGVTEIGQWAFGSCPKLTSVSIGSSVTKINGNAFNGCTSLTSVVLPDSLTTIDGYAFYECSALASISFGDEIKSIGRYAFGYCSSLSSFCVPDGVTSIGEYAFVWCDGLTAVSIPGSVTDMGDRIFTHCENLTSVELGEGIQEITLRMFDSCSSLKNINIPDSVTVIGNSALCACKSLESIVLGKGVVEIEGYAFSSCTSLSSVTVPKSVNYIYSYAFNNCDSLTDVYYAGSETDKKNMTLSSYNNYFKNATWHYNCINPKDHYTKPVSHSVMDTTNGNGLAFRFQLLADGIDVVDGTVADLSNATVNYLGTACKLLGMGAVLTNDASIGEDVAKLTLDNLSGKTVIDIPTVYLCDLEPDSCAFATRIINIPDTQLERVIYARPYYVVEVDGEEVVVYGDVDAASCAEYM